MDYRIQNFRIIDHATIRADFDIDFGPVKVIGFKLIEHNGGTFISEPSEKYTDRKTGETKHKKSAIFADDLIKTKIEKDVKTLFAAAAGQDHPGNSYPHPADTDQSAPF